jgi:hypothetical protein
VCVVLQPLRLVHARHSDRARVVRPGRDASGSPSMARRVSRS